VNDQNLIPFSELTESERRELASKAGKASGASRRRRKTMEQCAKFILSLPANSKEDWETLIAAGVSLDNTDPDDIDNLTVVNAALIAAAKAGDVKAYNALRDVIRDDEHLKIEKERLKLEKKKLESKDDNSDVFNKLDDVLSKIGE
jgi:hypothetical protein